MSNTQAQSGKKNIHTISLQELLNVEVARFASKFRTDGLLKSMRSLLMEMERGYKRADNESYSLGEKEKLSCMAPESCNVNRGAGQAAKPTPFLLLDIDSVKELSEQKRDKRNKEILAAAAKQSNYVAGWVSPSCGLNLIFWVPFLVPKEAVSAKEHLEIHQDTLLCHATYTCACMSQTVGYDVVADPAFYKTTGGLKQVKFMPHRQVYYGKSELLFDSFSMLQRPESKNDWAIKAPPKPREMPTDFVLDNASQKQWQKSLARVLEHNIFHPVSEAMEGTRNHTACAKAWQFGLFKYGYEQYAGSEWFAAQEQHLIELCLWFCSGGFKDDEACQQRVEFKIVEGMKYADENPSAIKEVTPDYC